MHTKDIAYKIKESNREFITTLRKEMSVKRISIQELSKESDVPESTMYKIMSDPDKDFRISTFRQMIKGMEKLLGLKEDTNENLVALITSREALDSISSNIEINGNKISVMDFPALTIEEEIIQGIRAERMGAKGILCGPVAANTLEKVVKIPVMSLRFENDTIIKGLEKLSYKF